MIHWLKASHGGSMKITHNKVGQNLNLIDGVKQDKTESARGPKSAKADALSSQTPGVGASRVEVSSEAQTAKRIKDLANAAPDVDMAKVEKFRQLIDDGKYKVDAKAVADKMVDDHLMTKN